MILYFYHPQECPFHIVFDSCNDTISINDDPFIPLQQAWTAYPDFYRVYNTVLQDIHGIMEDWDYDDETPREEPSFLCVMQQWIDDRTLPLEIPSFSLSQDFEELLTLNGIEYFIYHHNQKFYILHTTGGVSSVDDECLAYALCKKYASHFFTMPFNPINDLHKKIIIPSFTLETHYHILREYEQFKDLLTFHECMNNVILSEKNQSPGEEIVLTI